MSGGRGYSLSFVFFIALCIIILGVATVSWKVGTRSGMIGVSADYAFTISSYELEAGDRIYYEYWSNVDCWFVITTDPSNPEIGEKLNLSGTRSTGSFECQTDDQYYLRVEFTEMPEQGPATIDFESYALADSSLLMMTAKPIALTILTILLAFVGYNSYRRGSEANPSRGREENRSYWQYFASRAGNWVAIVAGAVMLAVWSVVDSLNPTTDSAELILFWLAQIGGCTVCFGLLLGLYITWGEYRTRTFPEKRP